MICSVWNCASSITIFAKVKSTKVYFLVHRKFVKIDLFCSLLLTFPALVPITCGFSDTDSSFVCHATTSCDNHQCMHPLFFQSCISHLAFGNTKIMTNTNTQARIKCICELLERTKKSRRPISSDRLHLHRPKLK